MLIMLLRLAPAAARALGGDKGNTKIRESFLKKQRINSWRQKMKGTCFAAKMNHEECHFAMNLQIHMRVHLVQVMTIKRKENLLGK